LDGMLCKHHFSKNGQVFFHIFWVVTLIMQSRDFIRKKKLNYLNFTSRTQNQKNTSIIMLSIQG
ncbi:hypothetical protein EFO83_05015, partial [Lacticaseibacillus rhamnosus]|nr:hypothetical protein [Lacticaseibacillus rhamnosus]